MKTFLKSKGRSRSLLKLKGKLVEKQELETDETLETKAAIEGGECSERDDLDDDLGDDDRERGEGGEDGAGDF